MSKVVSVLLTAASFFAFVLTDKPQVKIEDLRPLTGAQWTGTLTYLDYGKNKKVSIPSNLIVTPSAVDKRSWNFEYQYPDEPKANHKESVVLSKDGRTIDGETVIERTRLAGNTTKLVTEKSGTDNDKQASFRFTYLIGAKSFSIRKEVRYEGTSEFFERNLYSWKR
ncbi:MAG: hypothetical protein WCD76_02785 [Pyrinomonadaceae bacterium]